MVARAGLPAPASELACEHPAPSAVPLLSSVCRRCGPSSGRHFHFGDGQVSVCHWVDGGVCLHVLVLLIGFCVTCEGVGGPRARARGSDTVYLRARLRYFLSAKPNSAMFDVRGPGLRTDCAHVAQTTNGPPVLASEEVTG